MIWYPSFSPSSICLWIVPFQLIRWLRTACWQQDRVSTTMYANDMFCLTQINGVCLAFTPHHGSHFYSLRILFKNRRPWVSHTFFPVHNRQNRSIVITPVHNNTREFLLPMPSLKVKEDQQPLQVGIEFGTTYMHSYAPSCSLLKALLLHLMVGRRK